MNGSNLIDGMERGTVGIIAVAGPARSGVAVRRSVEHGWLNSPCAGLPREVGGRFRSPGAIRDLKYSRIIAAKVSWFNHFPIFDMPALSGTAFLGVSLSPYRAGPMRRILSPSGGHSPRLSQLLVIT